jgi:rhodanese-related sulfurtransferase
MKFVLKPMALLFALAFSNLALAAGGTHAPEISLTDLKKLVDTKGATIIDANSAESFDTGHIPTAVSFAKNEKNFASILPSDKKALLVAYCGGPMCTAWQEAAKEAQKLGYKNIKHFKGGLKGWKDSGNTLEAAHTAK